MKNSIKLVSRWTLCFCSRNWKYRHDNLHIIRLISNYFKNSYCPANFIQNMLSPNSNAIYFSWKQAIACRRRFLSTACLVLFNIRQQGIATISSANQWTGFNRIGTSLMKDLKRFRKRAMITSFRWVPCRKPSTNKTAEKM